MRARRGSLGSGLSSFGGSSSALDAMDATRMRSPAWVAVPDEDEEEVTQMGLEASRATGTLWWFVATGVMLTSMLLYAAPDDMDAAPWKAAPWWLVALVAAEAYASMRRLLSHRLGDSSSGGGGMAGAKPKAPPTPSRKIRHFTSLRLAESSPVDEIVAHFLSLDALSEVSSLELGSNVSTEGHSRSHSLGLLVTFTGVAQRAAYLRSPERKAFLAFVEPFVAETFVFDFESGSV